MPTPMFYDGQLGPEIRTKLNELGDLFQAGVDGLLSLQGWSPVLSVVADGSREVLRIVDWVGGDGDKPTTLGYVGASGIVADAASAVNVKGSVGNPGPANSLSIGTVVSGASASATISGTAPAQELNLVLPKGDSGLNGWSPVLAGATDGERRVLEVVDWVGGQGAKPTNLGYIGVTGIVANIADAVDVRGPVGAEGDPGPKGDTGSQGIQGVAGLHGWTPKFAVVTDGTRRVQQVVDWFGGTGSKPATGEYVGATGLVATVAQAVDIRGPFGAGTGSVNPSGTIAANDLAAFADASGQVIKALKAADLPVSTATQTALNGKAPLTGAGTSGTWPISITGNAATAPWAGVSGKPGVIAAGADKALARAAIDAVSVYEVITPFVLVTAVTQPAVAGVQYGLSNAAVTTLTLPASPIIESLVWVVILNNRSDNVLARNGSLIGGLAEDMTIDNPKRPFAVKFIGGAIGWVIL